MQKSINLNPVLLVGFIILAVLLYLQKCSNANRADKENLQLVAALQDTLRHYKNKDSINVATISVIQTQSARDFYKLDLKDKQLKELQAVVEEYKKTLKAGSSVTNALIETVAILKAKKPEIIFQKGDTVWKDNIAYVYPTYKDTINNQWIKLKAKMGKDSSSFDLKVENKFSAIIGYKNRKPFVDLLTDNPYTTVKQLRVYQVSIPRPKRFGIGFSTGVTLDNNLKLAPYVGVGVNYNLLRL